MNATVFEPPLLLPPPGRARPERPDALMQEAQALRAAIARFPTIAAMRADAGFARLDARFRALLDPVRRYVPIAPPAPPRNAARLHAVHWNIEHGNWYEQVEAALRSHETLAGADLVLLNEVDLGCARAANRDVAGDLADALGLHGAYAPMYLESTLGRDDDAACAGGRSNQEGLFGLAMLSRWPIERLRLVELPGPEAIQYDIERMFGRFVALVCDIAHPQQPFTAVSVHLEVHRTRADRETQMHVLMNALVRERRPIVLAGDFNSHTFDRGLWHTTFSSALPLITWSDRALRERLTRPDRGAHREGSFVALAEAGFAWEPHNDFAPTLDVRFDRLDEVRALPAPLRAAAQRGIDWVQRRARLRLDWIAARGLAPARGGPPARTAAGLDGPGRASDHAPIAAWFDLGGS